MAVQSFTNIEYPFKQMKIISEVRPAMVIAFLTPVSGGTRMKKRFFNLKVFGL
jgi:hypothetical protein